MTSNNSSNLLSQLEAWMKDEGAAFACVRQYPHPRYASDFDPQCAGCLIEHAALELRKHALSGDSPAVETPPERRGPVEPDSDMVICPYCTSQFVAIPVNVQDRLYRINGYNDNPAHYDAEIDRLSAHPWKGPIGAKSAQETGDDPDPVTRCPANLLGAQCQLPEGHEDAHETTPKHGHLSFAGSSPKTIVDTVPCRQCGRLLQNNELLDFCDSACMDLWQNSQVNGKGDGV